RPASRPVAPLTGAEDAEPTGSSLAASSSASWEVRRDLPPLPSAEKWRSQGRVIAPAPELKGGQEDVPRHTQGSPRSPDRCSDPRVVHSGSSDGSSRRGRRYGSTLGRPEDTQRGDLEHNRQSESHPSVVHARPV